MTTEADRSFPLETGGVLMGYWASPPVEVVITSAIGCGPRSTHKRHSFVPDYEYQEAEVARVYEESGRVHVYLGDWHTHPRQSVCLSSRDKQTLRRIGASAEARAPVPIMAVLGGGEPHWFIGIWRPVTSILSKFRLSNSTLPLLPRIYSTLS